MRHKYRKYQAICNKNLNNKYNPRLNKREKRGLFNLHQKLATVQSRFVAIYPFLIFLEKSGKFYKLLKA